MPLFLSSLGERLRITGVVRPIAECLFIERQCAARVEPERLNSAQIVIVSRCRGDDILFLSRHLLQDGLGPVELACLDQFVGLLGSLAVVAALCQSCRQFTISLCPVTCLVSELVKALVQVASGPSVLY